MNSFKLPLDYLQALNFHEEVKLTERLWEGKRVIEVKMWAGPLVYEFRINEDKKHIYEVDQYGDTFYGERNFEAIELDENNDIYLQIYHDKHINNIMDSVLKKYDFLAMLNIEAEQNQREGGLKMQKIPKSILSITVYKEAISEEIPDEMWEFSRLDDTWHLTHERVSTDKYWSENDVLSLIAGVEAFNLALEYGEQV